MNDIYNYFNQYSKILIELFLNSYYEKDIYKIKNYFLNLKTEEIPDDILIILNKMEKELHQANIFLRYRDFNDLKIYWKYLFYDKNNLLEGENMENIYTYFNCDKEIVDATFMEIKNHKLKENFVKRWGRELDGNSNYDYTKKDKEDFSNYKKIFEKNLEYAKSRYENGYSLEEITKSLRENVQLNLRLPFYENEKDLCTKLGINLKQLDIIFEDIETDKRLAFIYYTGLNRKKMNLVDISKLLKCDIQIIKNYILEVNKLIKIKASELEKETKRRIVRKPFLDSFKEEDKEKVKAILKAYKEINHKNFRIVTKLYGKNYNNYNYDIEMDKKELNCINNFKVKIKSYLKQIHDGASLEEVCNSIKNSQKKIKKEIEKTNKVKKSFLDSFEEIDKENVKTILNAYKEINHRYFQIVTKFYGENFDQYQSELELTKEEKNCLNNLKKQIKIYLVKINGGNDINKICFKITKKKTTAKSDNEKNIKIDKKMTGEDIIILKALYEKNMTIEEIVDSFGISKKTIDFCLIKNLHLFQNDIPTILLELLKRNNFSTSQIINHSYLKEEMKNLTELEKMYIYLKLDSYHNPYLDDKKIAEILGLSIRDIKYYQIMSKSDNLNELNKIFVKK